MLPAQVVFGYQCVGFLPCFSWAIRSQDDPSQEQRKSEPQETRVGFPLMAHVTQDFASNGVNHSRCRAWRFFRATASLWEVHHHRDSWTLMLPCWVSNGVIRDVVHDIAIHCMTIFWSTALIARMPKLRDSQTGLNFRRRPASTTSNEIPMKWIEVGLINLVSLWFSMYLYVPLGLMMINDD